MRVEGNGSWEQVGKGEVLRDEGTSIGERWKRFPKVPPSPSDMTSSSSAKYSATEQAPGPGSGLLKFADGAVLQGALGRVFQSVDSATRRVRPSCVSTGPI